MREKINKNLYRAILIISFLAANALIIFGISTVWGFLNTGADRSSMLHTEIKNNRLYLPKISWDTASYEGRPMEMQNLKEIEKDYLNSWYVKSLALETNEDYGIQDYYTDSARVNIYNTIAFNKEQDVHFKSTTISHEPELKFYSADGQLIVFNDHKVIEYSESYAGDEILDRTVDTSSYQVMMLLEDGFWRIRHMKKIQPDADFPRQEAKPEFPEQQGNSILFNEKPLNIKGVNYYPKDSPWDMFGDNFNEDSIEKDFELLKNAGLNTLRIFIPYEDFGKADVKKQKLEKLRKTLDLAEEKGLVLLITLFDFYGDYSVLDWTLTHEHARQIVSAIKYHPALLGWDVKNEPDLDFDHRGKELVLNWLKHSIAQIRAVDRENLITIGWAKPENAGLLQEEVDFVSFHYYDEPEDFPSVYKVLKSDIRKPLVLGEFGLSSYNGIWNPFGGGERGQAVYYKTMQDFIKKDGVNFMAWTLYDYEEVPASVVGRLPWRRSRQKHFGLLDSEGNKKASFSYISE